MDEAIGSTLVLCGSTLPALTQALPQSRYRVLVADGPLPDLDQRLKDDACCVVLDGDAMEGSAHLAFLRRVSRQRNAVAVTVSSDASPERIVAAMRAGAADYILRDTEGKYLRDLADRLQELLQADSPHTAGAVAAQFNRLAHRLYHDVRNPINNILGFLELLLDIPTTKMTGEQRHFLVRARSNSNKVLDLLREFIETADRMAGKG